MAFRRSLPQAPGAILIDRCLCFQQRFAELKAVAEESGAETVEGLQQHVTFGKKCGLCCPYVRRMLRTGETAFGEVVTEADEPPEMAGS